jgi:membrane-bound lytic murein transglycosylase B
MPAARFARHAQSGLSFLVVALLLGSTASPGRGADDVASWEYLMRRLVADGVGQSWVQAVFEDSRFPTFTGLSFKLNPVESRARYAELRGASSLARARRCRARYADAFVRAERRYGVPASVLAAIIHVESHCGEFTGRSRVLPALARLAMANEPANLAENLARHRRGLDGIELEQAEGQTRERAQYLERTFYPEVLATFRLAKRLSIDPLELRGSGSGAFGLPQFLPSSYLRYGIDANGNGRVSLFEPEDAIDSCANYLVGYGWRPGIGRPDQRSVIWAYNHSEAYVDTVLAIADHVEAAGPTSD